MVRNTVSVSDKGMVRMEWTVVSERFCKMP